MFSGQGGATNETGYWCDLKLSVVDHLELYVFKSVSFDYICLVLPWLIKHRALGLIISESLWVLCGTAK